jgi:hypothetical protein
VHLDRYKNLVLALVQVEDLEELVQDQVQEDQVKALAQEKDQVLELVMMGRSQGLCTHMFCTWCHRREKNLPPSCLAMEALDQDQQHVYRCGKCHPLHHQPDKGRHISSHLVDPWGRASSQIVEISHQKTMSLFPWEQDH